MKRFFVVGAALGALMIPAAASAQDGHDHGCLDETCTVVSLIQDADPATPGWQGTQTPSYGEWGFNLAGRDTSVNPGDDFFRYAGGLAFDQIQIPSDRTSYGSFALLRELSDNRMMALVEGLAARNDLTPGSDEAKIRDAYRSYMDEARIEALDDQPLQPFLAAVRAADTHEKMAVLMGRQGTIGASIFGTGISVDAKDPNRYVVSMGQGGLGLPNRDYYVDARYADKKEKYQAYIARMLEMIGWDDPAGNAAAVLAFEQKIAEAHWTTIQSRDRDRTYNEYTPASLAAELSGFDLGAYLESAELGSVDRLIVRQNTAMPKIAAAYAETPVAVLQAWQAFHMTDDAAGRLSRRFADAQWEFRSRDLSGQPEQRSRDKRGVSYAEGALNEAAGRLYAAEYFPPESKAKMEELVANLRRALSHRIDNLTWMGPETKAQAQDKLAKFEVRIGYPEKWRDYSALEIRPDDLFGNSERLSQFNWRRQRDRLDQPVDRTEWGMMPQIVNASYNSVFNTITFPGRHSAAALLRSGRRSGGELRRHRRGDRPRDRPRLRRSGLQVRRRRRAARLVDA